MSGYTNTNSLTDLQFINLSKKQTAFSHTPPFGAIVFYMFGNFPLQVVYHQAWNSMTSVLETNKTSTELQIPAGENYLIEIKALTEGGDGSSSSPIRIPKMSSKLPNTLHTLQHLNG